MSFPERSQLLRGSDSRRAGLTAAVCLAQVYGVDEGMARLSPLVSSHLASHGTYSFALPNLAAGAIRQLRDPDAPTKTTTDAGADQVGPGRGNAGEKVSRR